MKVVTVITDINNKWFNLLRLSCAINKLHLDVLVPNKATQFNNRTKDELLLDYISDEEENEIILFTDGSDVVLAATEDEIISKFERFESDLVFSAEMFCWPDNDLAHLYEQKADTPYNFLNSGGFIGKAGVIKQFLNDNDYEIERFPWSNQYSWTKRYLKNTQLIKLDNYCSIFCALNPLSGESELLNKNYAEAFKLKNKWFSDNIQINHERMYNKITKTHPCHLHFNGSAKCYMSESISNMVYAAIPEFSEVEFYCEQ